MPEEYYDILTQRFRGVKMWETVYYHTVRTPDDIISWYLGSGLRPYLDALSDELIPQFLSELRHAVCDNFIYRPSGVLLLKMPRLFFTAVKN